MVKRNCAKCGDRILRRRNAKIGLGCAYCQKRFHKNCADISEHVYKKIADKQVIWSCIGCRAETHGRKNKVVGSLVDSPYLELQRRTVDLDKQHSLLMAKINNNKLHCDDPMMRKLIEQGNILLALCNDVLQIPLESFPNINEESLPPIHLQGLELE